MMAVLEVQEVSRRYDGRTAVAGVGLRLEAGRIACLLGPSGCGKSTLLRMIAGLEPLDEGEIRIGGFTVATPGRATPPEARGVGLVFQDNALFPHLNVRENIAFGLLGQSRRARNEAVDRLLDQFQIRTLAEAWPHRLSGGEQQRVAIARAMARSPTLLLLDEPFSGLDGALRATVRSALLKDLRNTGTTVLMVTHDPVEAMSVADDLILMSGGRILQAGEPADCYRRPSSIDSARLLGELLLIPGKVSDGRVETALGEGRAPGVPGGTIQVGLRPGAIRLDPEGAEGEVLEVRFTGATHRLTLQFGALELSISQMIQPPAPGSRMRVGFDDSQALYFDSDGVAINARLPED